MKPLGPSASRLMQERDDARDEIERLTAVVQAARELRTVEGKVFGIAPAVFHARQVLDAALDALDKP